MTSTPSKLKTLQGVFDTPKIVYRRDFVRENKLNLKELQKLTNKNKQQQQQQQSSTRNSRQNPVNYTSQQRTASQQRANSSTRSSRNSICGDGYNNNSNHNNNVVNNTPNVRTISQRSLSSANISTKSMTSERCPSCGKGNKNSTPSILGEDKEIQTEDINDEEFLYDALKKCVGSETTLLNKPQEINVNIEVNSNGEDHHVNLQNAEEFDNMSANSRQSYTPYVPQDQRSVGSRGLTPRSQPFPDTPRSNYSFKSTNKCQHEPADQHDIEASGEPVYDHFERLSVKSNHTGRNMHAENLTELYKRPPLQGDEMSVFSHGTQTTRRSKQGSHKLGSREDIILPRYLEREKREKAEAYMQEMARDPKCPYGHTLLTEDQRQEELRQAQNHFNNLVSELNHMPMTTETLRARIRKQEIEKELTEIENKIRCFSKSIVYVPDEGFIKHHEQYQTYC